MKSRAALTCLLLLILGCGGSDKPKLYPVSGKVTVGGKPLGDVGVYFMGMSQAGRNYSGKTGSDGSYTLSDPGDQRSGAEAGKYKVVLQMTGDSQQKSMMEAMKQASGGPPQQEAQLPFPAEYTSGEKTPKEVEVKPQSNTVDITIP